MEHLTRYEMETLISFNVADKIASVSTYDKRIMRKLDQMVIDYPDTYKILREYAGYKEYEVPKKYISFIKPRKRAK